MDLNPNVKKVFGIKFGVDFILYPDLFFTALNHVRMPMLPCICLTMMHVVISIVVIYVGII